MSIDNPEVIKGDHETLDAIYNPSPASEEKSAVTVRGVLDSIFDCGVQSVGAFGLKEVDDKIFDDAEKMLDTLYRRKHAGEMRWGKNEVINEIKQFIQKWKKGED
jgi:hypothetical protein